MSRPTTAHDFAAFYDQWMPQVYRYIRYRVSDTAAAEDLTAEIFEKALRAWDKRRNPQSPAPWIFRIARNALVSYYRRRGQRATVPLETAGPVAAGSEPEDRVLQDERWARIQQGIRTLSSREQEIIALKFSIGLTNRAIAPIVGTSEGNVAVILHRAMKKLHRYLENNTAVLSTERSTSYG